MTVATTAGSILEERYQLQKLLGEGAHGAVWLATDIHLQRPVAIKLVAADMSDGGQTVARLQREAKVLQRLKHPNVVQLFRIGTVDYETFYLAMEHVQGRDLHAVLAGGPLPLNEAMAFALQIADGMLEAEKHGIIHRDLKPQNILVVDDGRSPSLRQIKVADFGLAKTSAEATMQFGQLTRAGSALGTPHYMSPEQCQGKEIDVTSDIYSFGCVLFELLTGEPPYQADSPAAILMKHVRDPVPNLLDITIRTEVAQQLQDILRLCLAKTPKERYQSFADLRADLEAIDVSNSSESIKIRTTRPTSSKRRFPRAALPVVASLVVVGSAAGAIAMSSDEQHGFLLARTATAVNSQSPQEFVISSVKLVDSVLGKSAGRKLAEGTVLSDAFRQWPVDRKMSLLSSLSRVFPDSAQNQESNLFAAALLDECVLDVAADLEGHKKLTAAEERLIANYLDYILTQEWNPNTWKAIATTLYQYAGTFQLHTVATIPDTVPYAMRLEELCGDILVRTSPTMTRDLTRTAAEMYFNAGSRAARTNDMERARKNLDKLGALHYAHEIDARLTLVGWDLHYGRREDAVKDFAKCAEIREKAPFTHPTTELTFQKFKSILANNAAN